MNRPPLEISNSKKLIFGLLPGLVLLVTVFAAGEIFLRVKYKKIERITGATEWKTGTWNELTYFWDRYHPRYGWTNTPGYRSDGGVPFRVTINSQGLRSNKEFTPKPAEGIKRIAVFGDSCTFGEEVDDDQTLPYYLERYLADAEVLNYGVHGYGLGQMALLLEDEGFFLHPDHIVVVLTLPSDIFRVFENHFVHNKPAFDMNGLKLQITNMPVPVASAQPWLFRYCFIAAWLFDRAQPLPTSKSVDAAMNITRALLNMIQTQCNRHGTLLTLVYIIGPSWIEVMHSENFRSQVINKTRRFAAELGIDVSDQIDFLVQAYNPENQGLAMPYGHWSGWGNCLIAGQIAQHLTHKYASWTLRADLPECAMSGKVSSQQ